jgi:hypothetical protein
MKKSLTKRPNILQILTKCILFFKLCKFIRIIRATKRIVGPQGKRILTPPPPIPQIMILKLSPPRCVISKESVQQKWIDELWFRKQLSSCLFVWTLNYKLMGPLSGSAHYKRKSLSSCLVSFSTRTCIYCICCAL